MEEENKGGRRVEKERRRNKEREGISSVGKGEFGSARRPKIVDPVTGMCLAWSKKDLSRSQVLGTLDKPSY